MQTVLICKWTEDRHTDLIVNWGLKLRDPRVQLDYGDSNCIIMIPEQWAQSAIKPFFSLSLCVLFLILLENHFEFTSSIFVSNCNRDCVLSLRNFVVVHVTSLPVSYAFNTILMLFKTLSKWQFKSYEMIYSIENIATVICFIKVSLFFMVKVTEIWWLTAKLKYKVSVTKLVTCLCHFVLVIFTSNCVQT